ncbi:MAG: ribonuclease HII [Candidatus Moranbacteria bacterium]|nr:ribonuclease HII [Candidatus Moranbacteria bacterium]
MENFFTKYPKIVGIDEAGRGPLAGPVYAAAVLGEKKDLKNFKKLGLKDSKKLTAKKRESLCQQIKKYFQIGIGITGETTIDKINILNASLLAMKKAVQNLKLKPDLLLIDGSRIIPNLFLKQKSVPQGDAKITLIQAASIVAKVERDNYIIQISKKYPEYGFQNHKGYGTKEHFSNLKKHGPCQIHRKSFRPVKDLLKI